MTNRSGRRGIVLGLTGPVCAGKSQVSRILRALGAAVYEADEIVRQLYERPDVNARVRELFGDEVFDGNGAVNRSAIAARVFGSKEADALRCRLTGEIIFPLTGELLRGRIDEFRGSARAGELLVIDAPTLFEAGRADWCDEVLFVTAAPDRRRGWAIARGWPPGELERRDAAMIPESEKRSRSTFVIENGGTLVDLENQVRKIWEVLVGTPG